MAHRITVTQLKCAVLDPVWRRKWLAGENPGTFVFPLTNKGTSAESISRVYGTKFHQETDRLAKWLTTESQLTTAAALDSPDDLMQFLWRSSLQDFTEKLLKSGRGSEAIAFTERLRSYCKRLIDLKKRTKNFENWQDVFAFTEMEIEGIRVPVGETTVAIRGRVDAIRFHPKDHLEVVDYKLSQGAQQKSDLVQLSIYAHLLPLSRPGCQFCGTLEYYLPEFMEVSISRDELAGIYAGLVVPVLNDMFATKSDSASAGPDAPAGIESVGSHPKIEQEIARAFGLFGLGVEAVGTIEGPQVTRVRLRPASGVKVSSLANRAQDLQVALALDQPPLVSAVKGFVAVDVPRVDRQPMELLTYLKGAKEKRPTAFPVGVGIDLQTIVSDFFDSNTCHILVAGTSGSGKSEWLKSLVASLAFRNEPDRVRLALVDPKILTFNCVKSSPYLWQPLATDIGAALAVLDAAVSEMETRYRTLAKEGFVSISDRIRAGRIDLPFVVLVFDEFADLILTGRNEKKEFEDMVARLAGKGRAAGVHLVLATQRPDRTVVTGLIKSNLPMKVCLRVANATNSQIVLGESGAESLLGKGDLICDIGRGLTRAQSYYIAQSDFIKTLQA
jgi:adenosyl cobinamide kinase/adenosyl cobinamide phosphate guanylyltransferase